MGRGGAKRFKPGGYDSSCAPTPSPLPPLAAPSPDPSARLDLKCILAASAADGVAHFWQGPVFDGWGDAGQQQSIFSELLRKVLLVRDLLALHRGHGLLRHELVAGSEWPAPAVHGPLAGHACCV